MAKKMELKIICGQIKMVKKELPDKPSLKLIPYFCTELKLSDSCLRKINNIKRKILEKENISQMGMTPRTFVASLIYLSSILSSESRTQREICSVTETSEVSIKKGARYIRESLRI